MWTHDAFVVETAPITHTLCGELSFVAQFMGNTIDETSADMKYDSAKSQFSI